MFITFLQFFVVVLNILLVLCYGNLRQGGFFLFICVFNKNIVDMSEVSYLTEEGLVKLKSELSKLVNVDRPNISKQIAEARDKGDLSENAEYDAAKEAQGLLEMKISKLQATVRNARIIDIDEIDTETVHILNIVQLKNLKTNTEMTYMIVSESEANLKEKKISVNTPIAQGLLGKKVGDVVDIKVPNGIISLEIINISI